MKRFFDFAEYASVLYERLGWRVHEITADGHGVVMEPALVVPAVRTFLDARIAYRLAPRWCNGFFALSWWWLVPGSLSIFDPCVSRQSRNAVSHQPAARQGAIENQGHSGVTH